MIQTWPLASRSAYEENFTLLTELNIHCGINLTAWYTLLSCAQKRVTGDFIDRKIRPQGLTIIPVPSMQKLSNDCSEISIKTKNYFWPEGEGWGAAVSCCLMKTDLRHIFKQCLLYSVWLLFFKCRRSAFWGWLLKWWISCSELHGKWEASGY